MRIGLGLGVGRTRGRTRNTSPALFTGDANTTVSVVSGWTRGTLAQNTNPRLIKAVSGLVVAQNYQLSVTVRQSIASSIFVRVSTDSTLATGDVAQQTVVAASEVVTLPFTATATDLYVGAVLVSSALGDYLEIENATYVITAVP